MKSCPFHDSVRYSPANQNSARTTHNGHREKPHTHICARIIVVKVELAVVSPGKSSCKRKKMFCNYTDSLGDATSLEPVCLKQAPRQSKITNGWRKKLRLIQAVLQIDFDSISLSFFELRSASNGKMSSFFEAAKLRGSEVVNNSKAANKNPGIPLK